MKRVELNIFLVFLLFNSYCFGQLIPSDINRNSLLVKDNVIKSDFEKYKSSAFLIEKILPKGYSKDGSTDYTSLIQSALDSADIVLLPNFPILINDKGISLNNEQVLLFQSASQLILSPTNKGSYNMIRIYNKRNIKIFDVRLKGDKTTHLGSSGQWGMGISVKSSSNVSIYGGEIINMWGDGIYIGQRDNKPSEDITISNLFLDNNRRNGISITSAKNVKVKNTIIINTKGQSPQSGIDIEPNSIHDEIENIEISDVVTMNNGWSGILIVLERFKGKLQKEVMININNHNDIGSTVGLSIHGFLKDRESSNLAGTIQIKNSKYKNNKRQGFYFYRTNLSHLKIDTDNLNLENQFNKYTLK